MKKNNLFYLVVFFLFTILLSGCASGLHYNANSDASDKRLEKMGGDIIDSSTTLNYKTDSTKVNALIATFEDSLSQVYEREKTRKLNHPTTKMLEVAKSNSHWLSKFFDKWKSDGIISKDFALQWKIQALRILHSITDLEEHKKGAPAGITNTSGNTASNN